MMGAPDGARQALKYIHEGDLMHTKLISRACASVRPFTLVLLACLLWLPAPADSQAFDVEVIRRPEYQETDYCLTLDGCRLCWKTHLAQNNRGVVQSKTQCAKSLEAQLQGLRALLSEIVVHNPLGASLQTLFWGRLASDPPQDDLQMAMRLALAAFQSDQWDRNNGRPVKGENAQWIRDLANSAMIYPELQMIFNSYGRHIQVSGVEKVLVLPAVRMPFFEQLKAHGVKPTDKLPYDCLTWFSIQ